VRFIDWLSRKVGGIGVAEDIIETSIANQCMAPMWLTDGRNGYHCCCLKTGHEGLHKTYTDEFFGNNGEEVQLH